jgi:polyferredoxin
MVVVYDHLRGEPRGKLKKNTASKPAVAEYSEVASGNPAEAIREAVGGAQEEIKRSTVLGDCIDCNLCVAVCPTGIDIRNGTQLECTNCTACIDACDEVMVKVKKPKGLVRFDSMTGVEAGKRKIFTTRVYAYTAVLAALLALDIFLLARRGDVESIILRSPGQLYQQKDDTHLTNLYTFILINKSTKELPVTMQLATSGGQITMIGKAPGSIPKGGKVEGAFFIEMPIDQLASRKTPVVIDIFSNGKKIDEVDTNFMGPGK